MLMLRLDAGVFKYLACDKVRVHLSALAGATSLAPLMRHPPEARHVALPLPAGRMSEVSDEEAPLRNVLVATTAFAVVVVVATVVAETAGAWPTASTGAE